MEAEALWFFDQNPEQGNFRSEVLEGLGSRPKFLSPKHLYDPEGSRLFDAICRLREYYPTRVEKAILRNHAADIGRWLGDDVLLVEPGAGSSEKVRLLLEDLRPHAYMPMDISREHLYRAARQLADDYPWLHVCAACADFTGPQALPYEPPGVRKVVFFPGSTIGNFEPEDAVLFMTRMAELVGGEGGMLLGVDLKKDPAVLNAAYNDTTGVTAAFNRNVLRRINRELGADFAIEKFRHEAVYRPDRGRVEMHLVSRCAQRVRAAGEVFTFQAGESIHTENSYKYGMEEFHRLARTAGLRPRKVWTDAERLFSVQYFDVADA